MHNNLSPPIDSLLRKEPGAQSHTQILLKWSVCTCYNRSLPILSWNVFFFKFVRNLVELHMTYEIYTIQMLEYFFKNTKVIYLFKNEILHN